MANVNCTVITAKAGDKTNCYTYNPYIAAWKTTDEINSINPYANWDRADYNIKATWNMPETRDMYVDFIFIDESSNQLPAYYICSPDTELPFIDFPLKDVYLDIGNYVVSTIHIQNYIDRMTWKTRANDEDVVFVFENHQVGVSPFIRFIKDDYVYLCKVSPFYNDRFYSNVSYTHNYQPTTKTYTDSSAGHFYNAEAGTTIALYPPFMATVDTATETRMRWYYNETNYRFIPSDTVTAETPYIAEFDDTYFDQLEFYTGDRYGNNCHYQYRPALEYMLTSLACTGIYFKYDGTMYLGYMDESGQTTGERLTADEWEKSAQYDSDSVFNFTEHREPLVPIDPDDYPDDPWDKINFGPGGGNLGVFAKFYLCTEANLADLRRWFGGGGHQPIPQGFDPMPQIIGLSQFATSVGGTAVDEAEITFRAADNTPVYTGVFCQRGSGADLTLDLGSIQIPLRMKERGVPFLDYSSTVELYIPFCGAFQLDPQTVLGRTVAVRMWMSTATGECFAIATADGSPIAYGSGIMNAEMPISSSGWGLYKAALTNVANKAIGNTLSEVGGIVKGAAEGAIAGAVAGSVIPGAGTAAGAAVGTIAGLVNAGIQGAKVGHTIGNSLTEYEHLKKSSTTSISGSLSSTAAWHQPFTPYIKITRPHYKMPSNYAHTQAIPLVATKTLSQCAGLTMCVKTDLSGINATEYEKTVIASLLESGVIV